MSDFTVEATMSAVSDGDWSRLRGVLDLVPGTLLIEDPEEPVLVFPVQADNPMKAFLFVDGILKLVDLEPVSGNIEPAPASEEESADETPEAQGTDAARAVSEWVDRVPPLDVRVTEDGRVEVGCP